MNETEQEKLARQKGMWCAEIDELIDEAVRMNDVLCSGGNVKKALKRLKKSYKAFKTFADKECST